MANKTESDGDSVPTGPTESESVGDSVPTGPTGSTESDGDSVPTAPGITIQSSQAITPARHAAPANNHTALSTETEANRSASRTSVSSTITTKIREGTAEDPRRTTRMNSSPPYPLLPGERRSVLHLPLGPGVEPYY